MHRFFTTCMATLLTGVMPTMAMSVGTRPEQLSTSRLEQRLAEIDSELNQLARYSLRGGTGSISYRSPDYLDPDHFEWVQVELEKPTPIDQIVLVPSLLRDGKSEYKADGFPAVFRIIAGTEKNTDETVIASFSKEDQLLPRIAPLIIPCTTTASWVRVEASKLSVRQFDGKFNLELAELLIFNGPENVAINRPVTISTPNRYRGNLGRKKEFLVDGFMPYQMDTAQGESRPAFLNAADKNLLPSITIDLEAEHPLSRIHLHTVELSDNAPQSAPSGYALPAHLRLEGANRADFSDAIHLVEYRQTSIYDAGPFIVRRFPETRCRYVRLAALEPYLFHDTDKILSLMGFAEIELFANGQNVALGKPAQTSHLATVRPSSLLTDGHNIYGHILPVRLWMEQLARRHELEIHRPFIATELNRRYTQQKTNIFRLSWLSGLLAVGGVFIVLVDRMISQRAIHRTRERIAADLHDELGANLHAIGLLSDFARRNKDNPDLLEKLMQRMRSLTERSAAAAKYCTNMLEAEKLYNDLIEDIRRTAVRLTTDHDHDLLIEGEERIRNLSPRKRIDLFLFYKECLTNITRHAEATQISTRLIAGDTKLTLTNTDNGQGMNGEIPASLKRRARLMRALLSVECPQSGGTKITLRFTLRRPKKGTL